MASALAFAGAGCTLGPDYVRPPVDTPDAYRFAGSAVPDDALAALPDWWKAFDDPELDALIDEGLAANHDLRIATARVDEFAATLAATHSRTLPQVGYGAGAVALVWLATRPKVGALLRPLIFLGRISYPLYLSHQYVGYAVMRALYARGAAWLARERHPHPARSRAPAETRSSGPSQRRRDTWTVLCRSPCDGRSEACAHPPATRS